jgi:hypothetical protein
VSPSSRLRRLAFQAAYFVLLVSGRAAARLAEDFRVLGAARRHVGPLVIVLQLPVLACWLLVRPISLAAYAACSTFAP